MEENANVNNLFDFDEINFAIIINSGFLSVILKLMIDELIRKKHARMSRSAKNPFLHGSLISRL